MGVCETKTVASKVGRNWNPIKEVLDKHSIEKLKNQWGRKQFELMIQRIQQKGKNGFDEPNFMKLFPKLNMYSHSTKNRIFKLFKVGDGDLITSKEIVQALTIIHKCDDQNLIGEMVFYVYCDEENKMRRKGFKRFTRENQKFLLENIYDQHNPVLENIMLDDSQAMDLKRFLDTFSSYQAEGFVELFSQNIDELEEQIARILQEDQTIKRYEGQATYIIQYLWFREWKSYMRWKYGVDIIFENQDKMQNLSIRKNSSGISKVSVKNDRRPGIIKNISLMSQISDGLKPGLREIEDFVFMPMKIGEIMLQIYKMYPVIMRSYPELYPVSVYRVFFHSDGNFSRKIKKRPYVTKYMSIKQFLFDSEQSFNTKKDVCFYKSAGNRNWQEIKNMNTKLCQLQINRRVYFCYFDQSLAENFKNLCNVTEKNGKKFISHRIQNYGQILDFPHQGKIKRGTVTRLGRHHVQLEYKVEQYKFERQKININDLKQYNYQELEKKATKNCLAGLANFQNNCYMNSVVQCIIRTHLFGEYLQKQSKRDGKNEQLLLNSLFQIYESSKNIQVIDTKKFKKNVQRFMPFFQGDQHQDAQQFLMSLLNQTAIEIKTMNQYKSFKQNGQKNGQKNQRVVQFFSGKRINETQCVTCGNKYENQEDFFTYSLSLPENKQEEYVFTAFPQNVQPSWGPTLYGLTLSKEITNYEYMVQVSKLLGRPLERLFFVFSIGGEWSERLQDYPKKQTYKYKSFGGEVLVYEVWNSARPQIDLVKKKKISQETIKLQMRLRRERQSSKKYGNIVDTSALIVQIHKHDTWEVVEFRIRDFIQLFEKKRDRSYLIKNISQISKKDQKESILEEDDQMKYEIRLISKTRNDDICFFCKKKFRSFYNKSWFFQSTCEERCSFSKDKILFESNKFLNECANICIVVDFQQPRRVSFPKKRIDESWQETKARKLSRKDELDSIFKDNFMFREELELKCSIPKCPGQKAYRSERIKVFPNILLLHINRFRYKEDNQIIKLENTVTYPENFDIMGVRYLLYGVVAHYGVCKGGHYISYICEEGQWFKCDDDKVTKDDQKQHINPNVYLLFYRRADFEPSLMSLKL